MTVHDEAVEAAIVAVAREFAISQEGEYDATAIWGTPEEVIRHALEAAAPFIAAQAWDEGFKQGGPDA